MITFKSIIFSALLTSAIIASCQPKGQEYLKLVDPFIGTGADGNTWPAASMPFGGV